MEGIITRHTEEYVNRGGFPAFPLASRKVVEEFRMVAETDHAAGQVRVRITRVSDGASESYNFNRLQFERFELARTSRAWGYRFLFSENEEIDDQHCPVLKKERNGVPAWMGGAS